MSGVLAHSFPRRRRGAANAMGRILLKAFASSSSSSAAASATVKRGATTGSAAEKLATVEEPTTSNAATSLLKAFATSSSATASPPLTNPRTSLKCATASEVLSQLNKAAPENPKPSPAPGTADASSSFSPEQNNRTQMNNILDIPWFSNAPTTCTNQWRKELSRSRKEKFIFKNTESRRFTKLMTMCANKLGTETTLEFFSKLGRETGVKEYDALIKVCIDKARCSSNEEDSLVQIHKAYQLFLSMKDRGIQIEEESYSPFLIYLIDMKMVQEFQMFSKFFKDENPRSNSRIGYYEMLLWLRVGNEAKIQELCRSVVVASDEVNYGLAESYLLAFCESDRKTELLQFLEVLGIKKISSLKYVKSIFKSLGRLKLESFAERSLLELKVIGTEDENISVLIFDYATSIPNLAVEMIISKFSTLHQRLALIASSASYDKLIALCCDMSEVQMALDIVDHVVQAGLNVSIESFHPIIHACEQSCDLQMVHPIYSVMCQHNLKLKGDTLKSMITLCVKMKDFDGAYNLLSDAKEMGEMPTASMYNVILAGYFREKNNYGVSKVLKDMKSANVKADAETFSYLIFNCDREEDIIKYHDQLRQAGIQITKHVTMALINAFAKLGNFEMAKQVVLDHEIPSMQVIEIKSALISALSSNGQISDALNIYDEIKQAKCSIDPKAIISLIEHIRTEGEVDRLCKLLNKLNDLTTWFDGCGRVILYCVDFNHATIAIDLLKQLKMKDELSAYMVIDQMFSHIWETEPVNLKIGMQLLRAIKEELGLQLSRTSLDFLLSTCVKAKDAKCAWEIWSEYETSGLLYNVLTFLRMYQALLASGEKEAWKAAKEMVKRVPKEDAHVLYILKSCKSTYRREPRKASSTEREN
ncbi:pentatricopeptide repeat-containing protein At4g04790, mitochondrial-like isoform X2 [Ananas comosus]|uniref:Pentatricopeptide repeat-containing protein At4g04790, mitochondrial-like isoform X2 n=1 Tax=Ananas comosus TaxID=4615 RepID=A0A6P5GD13_ANACO|nr:pentatricopeptide repeat-containing protein At4g04790, mitochondrial-like isoform X2 [Ananas comosus]